MKSGIVTQIDPYLMDPSLLVDPNLILDYGSTFKDETHCNPVDPLMDLINYNDDQLENIIFNSGLCGEFENPWAENEFAFEELLKDIVLDKVQPTSYQSLEPVVPSADLSDTCTIIETDIANCEEVYACSDDGSESVMSEITELESVDNESFQSECTEASTSTASTASTLKRKLSTASTSTSTSASPPKRRKARRSKRVQDERVKNQNKVAAMKYRKKKKDEKDSLGDLIQIEEEKNKKLKASVEELKVNIDVLKELLGKYLSPSQLKANSKKN